MICMGRYGIVRAMPSTATQTSIGIQFGFGLFNPIDVRFDTRVDSRPIFLCATIAPRHNAGQKEFIIEFACQRTAAVTIASIDAALK